MNTKWLYLGSGVVLGTTLVTASMAFNPMGGGRSNTNPNAKAEVMAFFSGNTYSEFKEKAPEEMLEHVDGEDEFNQMKERMDNFGGFHEKHKEMESIINGGDYNSFQKEAPEEMLEIIDTEKKFDKLKEAHDLQEEVRQIKEELDMDEFHKSKMKGHGMMMKHGMMGGMKGCEIHDGQGQKGYEGEGHEEEGHGKHGMMKGMFGNE